MDLSGWIPIRFYWQAGRPWVDWCQVGDRRLTEPFFDHTIENCLHDPYCLLFRHQTPIDVLTALDTSPPESAPNGFIFHMSRCGSTLVAQVLATLPSSHVVSEPSVIESIFRPESQPVPVNDDERMTWLRLIVIALGRPPRAADEPYFIKFSSWNTTQLPLIQRAFPQVPWIFLYRNPVEVLVSLRRNCGRLVPGAINPALLGLELPTVLQLPEAEYHARVLAKICTSAIEGRQPNRSHFVSYEQLPDAVWDMLPDWFGFSLTPIDQERMRLRARFGGKDPEAHFADDKQEKHRSATPLLRAASAEWLDHSFERMEAIRRQSAGESPGAKSS